MVWTVERDEHGTPLRMAWVPIDGERAPLVLVAEVDAEPRGMYCTPLNPHP